MHSRKAQLGLTCNFPIPHFNPECPANLAVGRNAGYVAQKELKPRVLGRGTEQASSLEPTVGSFATKSRVSLSSLVVVSQEPETDLLSHIVCKMVVQLFTHGPSLIPSQTLFEYAALLRFEEFTAPG